MIRPQHDAGTDYERHYKTLMSDRSVHGDAIDEVGEQELEQVAANPAGVLIGLLTDPAGAVKSLISAASPPEEQVNYGKGGTDASPVAGLPNGVNALECYNRKFGGGRTDEKS